MLCPTRIRSPAPLRCHHRSHPLALPAVQARFYAAETLLGLEHLHEQRILYRDLKPENVLICASGHIKLCDFGLAAVGISASATHISASGRPVLVGTTEYMAPEVVRQQTCGQAVDLWALGVLLFEMMTGEAPWHHKEQKELQVRRRAAAGTATATTAAAYASPPPLCLTPHPPSPLAAQDRAHEGEGAHVVHQRGAHPRPRPPHEGGEPAVGRRPRLAHPRLRHDEPQGARD